ncbi:MAG: DUF4056 domain-containing protein [Phycisphaerales bacterium]|nr:MAG: DUF4056 domain-containing protein [Phycisphaerales bacterium]
MTLTQLFTVAVILLVSLASVGCRDGLPPRLRPGCYPASTVGAPFVNPDRLGRHGYRFSLSEKNGIVYTCRGGHIDLAHLRIAADWTAYLTRKSFRHLMAGDTEFSYKLMVDRSRHYVALSYPADWADRSKAEREAVAREISRALGPTLAYNMTNWHEILTWFGYKCVGLPTAFASAFSWEDSYSNLLGTILATRALQDNERSFNKALTVALNEELDRLGALPASVARQATDQVKGHWFTGPIMMFMDIRKRNFDIGLRDGLVTPTLLPAVAECGDVTPASYPAPNLEVLARHGFAARLSVEPREWEAGAILAVAYPDTKPRPRRVDLAVHLGPIMDYIEQDALGRFGPQAQTQAGAADAR